jgi:hypothetical protein
MKLKQVFGPQKHFLPFFFPKTLEMKPLKLLKPHFQQQKINPSKNLKLNQI